MPENTTIIPNKSDIEYKKLKAHEKVRVNPILNHILTFIFLGILLYVISLFFWNPFPEFKTIWIFFFFGLCIIVAVIMFSIKKTLTIFGIWFSRTYLSESPFNDPCTDELVLKKFVEQGWQFIEHVFVAIIEMFILIQHPEYLQDTNTLVTQPTGDIFNDQLIMFLLLVQISVWICMGFALRFIDEPKKDYVIMFIHHIVTIFLITLAFTTAYLPMAIVVLFIHDVSDIPLDLTEMTHYLKLHDKAGYFISEIFFVICMIVWIIFRFYLLMKLCLIPLFTAPFKLYILFMYSFVSLLYLFHIYWFYLMIKILIKTFNGLHISKAGDDVYYPDGEKKTSVEDSILKEKLNSSEDSILKEKINSSEDS